ncbi:carbohydrate ABC transporter permease [Microbacterium resistens]
MSATATLVTPRDADGTPRRRPLPQGESAFDRTRRRSYRLFVAPALVVFAAILAVPTLFSIVTSFTKWSGIGPMEFVGIDNYVRMFRNPVFLSSLWNTFLIVVGVGIIVYVVAFALALVLQNTFGRKPIRSIIFFPTLIPGIVISVLWGFLFNPDGLVNSFLRTLGIAEPPPWLGSQLIFPTIMLGLAWLSIGTYAVILLAAADRIPKEYYEVADLAGASPIQRFRYVTLPLMWDVVSVTAVLWCVSALKTFEFLLLFSSSAGTLPSSKIWNIAIYSYAQAFPGRGVAQFGAAAACGVVMLLLALALTILARRVMRSDDIEY